MLNGYFFLFSFFEIVKRVKWKNKSIEKDLVKELNRREGTCRVQNGWLKKIERENTKEGLEVASWDG
jgi:hypothetical protein